MLPDKETKVREWYYQMSVNDRVAFANRAGVSYDYLRIHLLVSPSRRIPRGDLLHRLVEASAPALSRQDWLDHLYGADTYLVVLSDRQAAVG